MKNLPMPMSRPLSLAGFHHIPSGFALCESPALVLPSGMIAATREQSASVSWVSCMDQLCPSAQVLGTQGGSLRGHWCWWAVLCHRGVWGSHVCLVLP